MKVKKVLGLKSDANVVQMIDVHKDIEVSTQTQTLALNTSEEDNRAVGGGQQIETIDPIQNDDNIEQITDIVTDPEPPQLEKAPKFWRFDIRYQNNPDSISLESLPLFKPLPDFSNSSLKQTTDTTNSLSDTNIAFNNNIIDENSANSTTVDCNPVLTLNIDNNSVQNVRHDNNPVCSGTVGNSATNSGSPDSNTVNNGTVDSNPVEEMADRRIDSQRDGNPVSSGTVGNNAVNSGTVSVDSERIDQIFDSINVSDEGILDSIINEFPDILNPIIDPIIFSPVRSSLISNSCVDSSKETQNSDSNINFTKIKETTKEANCDHNIVEQSQSCSTQPNGTKDNNSVDKSVVTIDLSDETSTSPLTPLKVPNSSSNQPLNKLCADSSNTSIQRNIEFRESAQIPSQNQCQTNDSHLVISQTNGHFVIPRVLNENQCKMRSPKVKHMIPFQYCASNHRFFNMTRHSTRHKTSNQNEDYDYENESLADITWDQIDGSQYEAKVSKWSDEDMNEDKRLEILRKVIDLNFIKSVYESDRNVFYCYKAFPGQSRCGPNAVLYCLMRLDPPKAVKGFRFTKYRTRLFLLSGNKSIINVEHKSQKSIDIGQEVSIPPHTRYELKSEGVENCYFYVILTEL